MKNTLRKLTVALMTVLVATILFAALPAAADEAQTGEIQISWTSGFMKNDSDKAVSALGSDPSAWKWLAVSGGGFFMTDVITVTKAGTTVSVTVPTLYTGSAKAMILASFTSKWECKTAADLIRGLATYNASTVAENYDVSVDESGAATLTGAFAFSKTSNFFSTNSNFTATKSEGGYTYTYTTQKDNEHFVFSSYGQPSDVTLSYSYSGEGKTQVYTTEKPADEPTLDTSAADDLTEAQKAMLFEAVERYGVADQATFDLLCEAASAFTYDGIAARVQKGVGIRSLYTANHTLLDASSADRITYGAIMGVGEYKGEFVNETTDLAVSADASVGYIASSRNSKAIVVYDSEGASYATEKYARKDGGLYTFAFTTVFGDSSMSPLLLRETELVYRGFIAVTVGDATYILYADASGDTFGREGATYGAATSLLEVSKHFREVYVDESGEKVFADNVILKENIAASMDTEFIFTAGDFATSDADGSVAIGDSMYYAAEKDGEGNVRFAETLVMKTGTANKITLTVETAREGFYRVAMKGNTLGSQIHYIYWKNTSLKTGIKQFRNGTRLAANTSRRTNYGTALGDTWANLYTVQDSFRVIPTLEETHKDTGEIYLSEGKNVIDFWVSSSVSESNYRASYFGLSELSFTLENELDADAIEIATYNGSVYADGYDKVSYSQNGATYPNTDTTLTLGKSNDAGITLRAQSNANLTTPDRVWYNFSLEKSGIYEFFLAYGGYAATYEILNENDEVIYTYSIPKDPITSATHSTAVTYASAGETYLAAGDYTVRLQLNAGATYGLLQGFFFSPTDKMPTVTVNYLDYLTGETVAEPTVHTYEANNAYSIDIPDVAGYIYKSHDEVYGVVEGNVVRNVYYAKATVYEVYGKDMGVSGSAKIVAATDGTQSVYLPIGSSNKATVSLTVDVAGYYDIDFIYNSLGKRVNYLYIENTSDAFSYKATTRFNGSGSKRAEGESVGEAADYAVTAEIASAGYADTSATAAIYLKEGENMLSLYIDSSEYYNIALYSMRFTLRDDLSGKPSDVTVLQPKADSATGKSGTVEGGGERLFFRYGTAAAPATARHTVTIPSAGYYELTVLYGSQGRGYIKNVTTGESFAINPTGTSDVVNVGGCSTAAVNGASGILYFDAGENTVEFGMNSGSWLAYHLVSFVKIGDHKIEVSYENKAGETLFDGVTEYVFDGYSYSYTSPVSADGMPSTETVSGIARDDVSETVVYALPTYKVTVHYVYENGTTAKDTLTVEYEKGVSYSVESPVIPGYKPSVAVVEGTANADRVVTVTYTENRVTLTFTPVDPNGNAINGVSLGTLSVLAGNAYEYTLPTIDGYLIRETALSGTAGYADESIPVTLYDAYYDYSVSGGTITGTVLETGDGYLPTVETKSLTFKITPDVSGAYAIYGVVSTKGAKVDVTAKNPTAVWGSSFTYGRIAAYTTQETTNAVPTDRAEVILAYQYLTAGIENKVTVGFSGNYVGVSSISFALVTPEFETADNDRIVTGTHTDQDYTTSGNIAGFQYDTGHTLIRNYKDTWAEYDLTVNRTGIYDLYGLISVQNAGATTLLLTNKSTGKETPLVFNAKNVIQIAGKSSSSTETAMIEGMTLYKGEYTVRITTTSGYFAFSMLRFNFVSELETGSTADGEYVTEADGKTVAVNANYYPGFTRKAVTFSEDDGNVTYDPLFIALLNQYGFKGTFNLYAAKSDYSIYAGHEIANHGCHEDGIKTTAASPYTLSTVLTKIKSMNSQLNSGIAADGNTQNDSVTSFVHPFTSGYRFLSDKVYTDAAELSALAALFTAEGKTEYTAEKLGKMTEAEIFLDYLNAIGITSNRYVSNGYGGSTNFDLPEDFMLWEPTLHQSQLKNTAQDGGYSNTYANAFRDLADDGKMKVLYIWGHSFELVNEQYPTSSASSTIKEEDLIAFLNAFSGDAYYKDTVSGIREYVDATRSLIVSDGTVYNPSDVTVYITVTVEDGDAKRIVLAPGETYTVTFTEKTVTVDSDEVTLPSGSEILPATAGYDASFIWKNGTTVTLNLTAMQEGYYAVYAKMNATHGYISETTLTNKTASDLKSEALNAVKTENTAWSGYTTGGRIKDYKGGTTKHSYDSANLDQYKVASDNGYVLVGYQYLIEGSNKITVSTNDSTVGVSSFKFSAVAEIPSDAIHILSGTYSYAAANDSANFTAAHNNVWMRHGATVQYTVNIPTDGEYAIYMMAGGNKPGVEIKDGAGWELKTAANGDLQVGGASQSHVAFALPDALMLSSGEATITLTCSGGYGKYAMITLVRVGEYVAPDSEFNVRGFTHDLSAGTASATVSLLAPDVYGAVLAICDLNGNILGYDALVKGYDLGGMEKLLSVTLTDADDIAAAAGVKVFTVTEATLAEIESDALTREIAEEFEYRTVDGVRLLIVSDEHYAIGKTTRVGPLTGKTYTTGSTNSNSQAGQDKIGQHNNYGVDSEQHIQAMIDAIKKEYAKQPFDAVMYLGDMTDMDYWYKRIYNNPTAFLSDTNGDGTVDFEDFYKSDYDEIYYVKTEYYNQLLSFDSDGDGENDASLPFFMTLGNHDLYKDEWFFDLTKPTADYEIGTTVEVADGISICYVSLTDYVVLFEKNGEKDTAFGMIASHRTAGAPLEKYLSGGATTIQHIATDALLLQEMKNGVSEMLSVSKDYKQVFFGCHMLGDTYFSEFLAADGRIRALFMGDSHVERDYTIGGTGVYNINDGSFAHTFGMQYGFDYNFAAEPWGYVILETHGTVSETYHVNPTWDYDISEARFFRYNDEEIRAKSYSEDASAAILAMLNEKAGTSYTTLKDARAAGLVTTYKNDVDAIAREDFLTRLYAAWTTLGLIDGSTTDLEKAKMIRHDAESLGEIAIGQILHALMFAETTVKLGENAPGTIVKEADGTLLYCVEYRHYDLKNLYRGELLTPVEK